jgi:hypothetical protein
MTDYTKVIERERKRSLVVVKFPHLYEPSKVMTCELFLRQHPSPVIQLYPVKGDA